MPAAKCTALTSIYLLKSTLTSIGPVSVPAYRALPRSAPAFPMGAHSSREASVAACASVRYTQQTI